MRQEHRKPVPGTPPPNENIWWWRFNRFLERHLPEDLYRRALLIVILPVILLQIVITGIFLERHWEQVTKRLSKAFGRELGMIVRLYEEGPKTEEALKRLEGLVNETLGLRMSVLRAPLPRARPRPWFSILHYRLSKYVRRFAPGRPFWIDTSAPDRIDVRILMDENLVFRFHAPKERVYASSTWIFLLWMVMASLLLLGIAVAFLRKQIAPILQLAEAAQAFGKGREVADFQPRGASEVRAAAEAFLRMKQRIERHVEQRTAMLAGVSHDLRTILTRFRLELSLLDGGDEQVRALKRDVDEMQRMLEGYIDFVRGAGDEAQRQVDICALLRDISADLREGGERLSISCPHDAPRLHARPQALKRALRNVVENALRHARARVRVGVLTTGEGDHHEEIRIVIEDDGPGIAPEERERVFRPFVRLDSARNMDGGGTGLGLSIARDIVQGHGGDIRLDESALGGLRVEISLPV